MRGLTPETPPELEARVLAGRARNEDAVVLSVPPDLLGPVRDMLESGGDLAREVGEVLPPRTDGKALLLR